MPARNPRVTVVLEKLLHDLVSRWARRDRVSVSLKVRDVIRAAVAGEEDRVLAAIAAERERTFTRRAALTHDQVWGTPKRRRG
jgi:plasmid stability protein